MDEQIITSEQKSSLSAHVSKKKKKLKFLVVTNFLNQLCDLMKSLLN